jgi:F0F1-type ATP synthase membrane subunit b/b'
MEMVTSMMSSLGINSSFFVMFLMLCVGFWISSPLLFSPLSKHLVERDSRTEGREIEIHQLSKELAEISEGLRLNSKKARAFANDEYLKIRAQAVETQKNLLNKARENAANEIKTERDKVSKVFAQESQKISQQVPIMAEEILNKILKG